MLPTGFYFGCCFLFVGITLYGRWKSFIRLQFGAKFLASMGFVGLAIEREALNSVYGSWIAAALIFSLFGDLFLVSKKRGYFLSGLTFFLIAHLAYIAAFFSLLSQTEAAFTLFLGVGACMATLAWWIIPKAPEGMRVAVGIYILAITIMMGTALNLSWSIGDWIYALGGALFCASDLAVARQRFMAQTIWNPVVGLPLYYAAQLILAYSVGP